MNLIPPAVAFRGFLDSVYTDRPIRIVETGCMRDLSTTSEYSDGWSTLAIARWVKEHPESTFDSVDLSIGAIELAHTALEAEGLAKYCNFHLQDSLRYLGSLTWADFCFLDSSDGLEHGLQEFRLAASIGAGIIVLDDYETKGALACKEAKQLGWSVTHEGRYSVLRRPR
jgi:hypothetical protein